MISETKQEQINTRIVWITVLLAAVIFITDLTLPLAFAPAGFTLSLSRLGPRRPPIAGAGSPRDGP